MSKTKEKKNKEQKTFWSFLKNNFMSKLEDEDKKEEEFKLGWLKFKKEILSKRKEVFLISIGVLVLFGVQSTRPYLQGKILDFLIHPLEKTFFGITLDAAFWVLILYFILTSIHAFLVLWVYYYKGEKLVNETYKKYYKDIFQKIIFYPVSFFKDNSLGKVTYTLNKGVDTLSQSVFKAINFTQYPILLTANVLFLFYLSWEVAIWVLFIILLLSIITYKTATKRKQVVRDFNEANKKIGSFLSEKINFAIDVKKNIKEKQENKNLSNLFSKDYTRKFWEKINFEILTGSAEWILIVLITAGTLLISIFLYKAGGLSEGSILALLAYSSSTVHIGTSLLKDIKRYIESFTLIGDTEKLLLNTPENYEEGKKTKEISGEIEFKNVDFEYKEEKDDNKKLEKEEREEKKKFSLKNINLKIHQGQKVAFVGESGGGKSTSIDLIGGFYFPNKGDVFVDNISTKEWNLNTLRSSIAYVSQDISIFNTTIGENISYGALEEITQEEIEKAAKEANISEFIDNLPDGYNTNVGEKGLKLSGGQKQRIAIARAILRNPKILILDEPTSALDIKSEVYITESLKELMKNRTTIIIAHRLSTVRDSDKIYVFKNGKVVEEGSYIELKEKDGEFNKMVELSEGLR